MDREKVYQMYRELAARETAYREEQSENDRRLGIKDLYREEAARGTRMLYELGFSPSGDNGDISVRDPETGLVYISASPIEIGYKNLGEYHACDMAVVDMEGNRMTTWSRPTIEMPMHLAILRARPDVNAVVHTHAAWSSVFAICGKNIPFVLAEQYAHLGAGEVVCAGYGKAGSDELGEEIVSALGKNNAVLMRNHGAVTVGAPSTKRLPTPVSSNASPRRRCSPPCSAASRPSTPRMSRRSGRSKPPFSENLSVIGGFLK